MEILNKARSDFIHSVIDNANGEIVYLGVIDPDKVGFQHSALPALSGDDQVIEYHAFEMINTGIPLHVRWRFKQDANITSPIHINTTTQSILSC